MINSGYSRELGVEGLLLAVPLFMPLLDGWSWVYILAIDSSPNQDYLEGDSEVYLGADFDPSPKRISRRSHKRGARALTKATRNHCQASFSKVPAVL